ncbi:NADPH-dependent FMN reductase [Streptomyces lonarensis]|uniref:NAD(P)H-dependent oxidoreductase n=1 Tax=Streptomyces lonarensis TaxID=700599 RepID=A0A7X6D5T1_9ACTN|nr:NAD(P)H-dependent oxidoreductase [Streptomyces lonarensis]NJQ08724.1 NAD(P)H-dependent oxidoreductase [Streptomyces lonarensis]
MHRELEILGIAASARKDSTSGAALDLVLTRAAELGCRTRVFRLAEVRLPFCDGDKSAPWPGYPAVAELRESVTRAHGVVLATPEYHGGMSGALKNALDLLDFPHAAGRVFGGISALGGRSNSNALNQLRTSVRWLHGWMLPDQVAIPEGRAAHTDGRFHDPVVAARLTALADSLVRATRALVLPPAPHGGAPERVLPGAAPPPQGGPNA